MKPQPGEVIIGALSGRAYLLRVSSKEESDTKWSLPEGIVYTQLIEHYDFDNESQMYAIIDECRNEWVLPVIERLDIFAWLLTKDPRF